VYLEEVVTLNDNPLAQAWWEGELADAEDRGLTLVTIELENAIEDQYGETRWTGYLIRDYRTGELIERMDDDAFHDLRPSFRDWFVADGPLQ
jgi:hypothetical protein